MAPSQDSPDARDFKCASGQMRREEGEGGEETPRSSANVRKGQRHWCRTEPTDKPTDTTRNFDPSSALRHLPMAGCCYRSDKGTRTPDTRIMIMALRVDSS
jgi:hypothetical protein